MGVDVDTVYFNHLRYYAIELMLEIFKIVRVLLYFENLQQLHLYRPSKWAPVP